MDKTVLLETLIEIITEQDHDIRSPAGLYDYPKMWNLLDHEGRTMAFRPMTVQERRNVIELIEVPGFSSSWHVDGEWVAHKQHEGRTQEDFCKMVSDLLEAGARPIADPLVRVVETAATPSP